MILAEIVARKKEEVAVLKRNGIHRPEPYQEQLPDKTRGFYRAIVDYPGVAVIAEIKKASPSKGVICHDFQPVRIAVNYEKNGARALSVLTDRDFFQGSLLYLMQARAAVGLPVLRKDFIIDPLQIEEASAHGADAILLIAAILETSQIQEFQAQASALGMDSLVEIHDEQELEKALDAGAGLIGINNRNLNDFSVDLNTTFRLKKLIPAHLPVVSESGLRSGEDVRALEKGGIAAALIGETLMRAEQDRTLIEVLHPHTCLR